MVSAIVCSIIQFLYCVYISNCTTAIDCTSTFQTISNYTLIGILDQGEGVLIIFEEPPVDKTYEAALETIQNMSKVVDSLYNKAKKLT